MRILYIYFSLSLFKGSNSFALFESSRTIPMKKMMSAWFKKKGSINFTQNKVQIESVKLECTVLHSLTLIDEERVCGESEMRRRNIDLVSIK